jgi:hypothetical protein
LNPVNRLESNLSWGVDVGIVNMPACLDQDSCLGAGIQVLGGYAFGADAQTFWAMPFLNYKYGSLFKLDKNYFSVGYQLGYLLELRQRFKLLIKYEKEIPNRYQIQDTAEITGRYNFKINQSIDVQWSEVKIGENASEARINYHYFF